MRAEEMGRHRYRYGFERTWSTDSETRFIRRVFQVFPDAYEIDRDGNPVPLEQLTLEG